MVIMPFRMVTEQYLQRLFICVVGTCPNSEASNIPDTAAAVGIDPYGKQDIVKRPRFEEGTASSQPPLIPSILRDAAQNSFPAQASAV
jgi:hypothetical protein